VKTRAINPSNTGGLIKTPTVVKDTKASPIVSPILSPTQDVMHLASPPSATKSELEKIHKEFSHKFAIAFKKKFFKQRGPVKADHLVSPSVLGRYDNDGPNPEEIQVLRLRKE